MMTQSLRDRLLQADAMSLSLISQDPSEMETFYRFWSGLEAEVSQAVDQASEDSETMSLAHQVASRVEALASRFLDFYDDVDAVTTSLQQDLEGLFAELTTAEPLSLSVETKSSSVPPYINSAYSWLMDNLHNPYPSKEMRMLLATNSGCSSKDIDNWFISIRRRIGWNALRAKSFSNKRNLIVTAATRFFKTDIAEKYICGSDSSIASTSIAHLRQDFELQFITIYNNAKELYPAISSESSLSGLGLAIDHPKPSGEKRRRRKILTDATPTPSSGAFSPCSTDSTKKSRKRRSFSSDFSDDDLSTRASWPRKRQRFDAGDSAATCFPSPKSAVELCLGSPSSNTSAVNEVHLAEPVKRKRRYSDVADELPHKRLCHMSPSLRYYSVSNPLPASSSATSELTFDDLFNSDFTNAFDLDATTPPPATTFVLNDLTTLDVDCYQYDVSSALPELSHSPSDASQSPSPLNASSLELPSLNDLQIMGDVTSNTLQGVDVTTILDVDPFAFNLDEPLISPFCQSTNIPSFNKPQTPPYNLSCQIFQPDLEWMSLLNPADGTRELSMPTFTTSEASGFSTLFSPHLPLSTGQASKFERVQFLREELRRLEADEGLL